MLIGKMLPVIERLEIRPPTTAVMEAVAKPPDVQPTAAAGCRLHGPGKRRPSTPC